METEEQDEGRWSPGLLALALPALVAAIFAIQVKTHALLADDAFISFRYAAHLADGRGPVWNTGWWVEGYTNFLWVVMLAAGIPLGLRPEVLAPWLGVACASLLLASIAAFSARRFGIRDTLIWLAPATVAAHRSFAAFATSGLETACFSLLVFLAISWYVDEWGSQEDSGWRSSIALGLATMTRPDGAIFAIGLGIVYLIRVATKERTVRQLVRWVGPAAALVAAHEIFRLVMYGSPLPNTFYVKVNGFQAEMTGNFFRYFLTDFKWHWFAPLALLAVVARRDRVTGLLVWLLGFYLAYVAYVGGDFLEFRFFVPVLPLMYLLVEDGIRVVWSFVTERAGRWTAAVVAAPAAMFLVAVTAHGDGLKHQKEWPHVSNLATIRGFCASRIDQGKFIRALMDDGVIPADLRIATKGAGALPYYTDAFTIDIMGLNDKRIARLETAPHLKKPGHQKMASDAHLRKRKKIDWIDAGPASFITHPKWRNWANKPYTSYWYNGRVRVVEVRGRLLMFGSHQSLEELEERFPKLHFVK